LTESSCAEKELLISDLMYLNLLVAEIGAIADQKRMERGTLKCKIRE
jgi:hypothetical protein